MQTTQVIRTLEWLQVFGKGLVEELSKALEELRPGLEARQERDRFLTALYEHARLREALTGKQEAALVVEAFGLGEALLKPDLMLKRVALLRIGRPSRGGEPDAAEVFSEIHRMRYIGLLEPWRKMLGCLPALKRLTVPPELTQPEALANVITVNLAGRESLNLGTVINALTAVQSLYDTVNRIHGQTDRPSLQILKIESGTNLRVDLRGLGEPIKEIKNFIIEMWSKHRHKRVDEIIDHHRAVASSIELLQQIDRRVKAGGLTSEDGTRFTRAVVKDTLGLFKNGALIDEIPGVEHVDNLKLLGAFGPKLLPAPEGPDGLGEAAPVIARPAPGTDGVEAESSRRKRSIKPTEAPSRGTRGGLKS